MRSSFSWYVCEFLTEVSHSNYLPQRRLSLKEQVGNAWNSIKAALALSTEPFIWKTVDANGRLQWRAYDPTTRQSIDAASDADLRSWLEDRHYYYHQA